MIKIYQIEVVLIAMQLVDMAKIELQFFYKNLWEEKVKIKASARVLSKKRKRNSYNMSKKSKNKNTLKS